MYTTLDTTKTTNLETKFLLLSITATKKRKKKTNLVVPSNSGGCSAVASNDGGNFSGTLLSKLPIQKTKQKNRERSIKQQKTKLKN
jgi:hypothetical protein